MGTCGCELRDCWALLFREGWWLLKWLVGVSAWAGIERDEREGYQRLWALIYVCQLEWWMWEIWS